MIKLTSVNIDDVLRNRIVGAVVVTILAMIFLPMLLNEPKEEGQEISSLELPQKPENSPSLTATILPDESEDVLADPLLAGDDEQDLQNIEPTTDVDISENEQPTDVDISTPKPQTTVAETEVKSTPKTNVQTSTKVQTPSNVSAATIANAKKLQPPRLDAPPANITVNQGERWFIQVASFSTENNANAFRDKLRRQGFSATVDSVWVKSKRIYRLRVGPELNRERAEMIKNKLNQLNNVQSIILSE